MTVSNLPRPYFTGLHTMTGRGGAGLRCALVAVGTPHHVIQRGNNRQPVFHSQQDYQVYPVLLAERARQHECRVLGHCLMPNHVHLAVIPDRGHALARVQRQAHTPTANI